MRRTISRPRRTSARAGIAVVAVTAAALVLGPFAAPSWATSAAPPSGKAIVPVDVKPTTDRPRTDLLGAPAASTIIQSDKLLVQSAASRSGGGWGPGNDTSVRSDTLFDAAGQNGATQLAQGSSASLFDLHRNYPTASGRFTDKGAERAVALHLGDLKTSAVLAVTSASTGIEAPTLGARVAGSPAGGSTVQMLDCSTSACSTALSTEPEQTAGTLYGAPSAKAGDAGSEWFVREAGDAGAFQFVNRLTGQCLAASGAKGTLVGCDLAATPTVTSQLWTVSSSGTVSPLSAPGQFLQFSGAHTFTITKGGGTPVGFFPLEQAGGVLPTWSIPAAREARLPNDLATGDLDRFVNAAETYGDEAAVAYVDDKQALHVSVVDYNRAGGLTSTDITGFTVEDTVGTLPSTDADGNPTYSTPGTVGVEIGDFDGDFDNEIAVVYQTSDFFYQVAFLAYDGPGELTVLSAPTTPLIPDRTTVPSSTYAVTSGDFAGLNRAQLAVTFTYPNDQPAVGVVSFAKDLIVDRSVVDAIAGGEDYTADQQCDDFGDAGQWCPHAHRLEPALLEASADAADFTQRQLAFDWSNGNSACIAAARVTVEPADGSFGLGRMGDPSCVFNGDGGAYLDPIPLAAGAFEGRDATASSLPMWTIYTTSFKGDDFGLDRLYWDADDQQLIRNSSATGGIPRGANLIAYDQDDSSLRLGAPLIVQLQNDESPVMIAAAPPSHVDWLYNETTGQPQFTNISAAAGTSLTMGTSVNSKYDSVTSSDLSASIGVTSRASVGGTMSFGNLFFKGTATLDVALGLAATTTLAEQNNSNSSTSQVLTTTSKTGNDDLLRVKTISQTIYRYPVLGGGIAPAADANADCGDACYAYYDIALPIGSIDLQADMPGKSLDWYQPTWVNGNALSYPIVPVDAPGPWTVPSADGTVQKTGYIAQHPFRIGQDIASADLAITTIDGTTKMSSSKTTLKESTEVKQSAKATIGFAGDTVEGRETFDLTIDNNQAFGTTDTGTTTTSSTSSIRVDATNASFGQYAFTSSYYYDQAGVPKVTHTVDVTAIDKTWWTRTYGGAADPALALPFAINIDNDSKGNPQLPRFASSITRQEIRGFEALQASESGPENAIEYASAPTAGDEVTFSVPVHNYSLMGATNTKVKFFAAPVDLNGDPTGDPQQIGGEKTIASIGSREAVTAYSDPWKAVGPSAKGQQTDWHIFVQLNPDADPSSEVHPFAADTDIESGNTACPTTKGNDAFEAPARGLTDKAGFLLDPMTGTRATTACGSNNQGYGAITVIGGTSTLVDDPTSPFTAMGAHTAPDHANVHLDGAGFRTDDESQSTLTEESDVPELTEGVPVDGTVMFDADADSDAHQRVRIYDGVPDQGGTLIASTTLKGVGSEAQGHVHFSWTPTGAGRHQLYQEVLAESGAGETDAQIVNVDVVASGASTPASPSPGAPEPADPGAAAGGSSGGTLAATGTTLPVFAVVFSVLGLLAGGLLIEAGRRRTRRRRHL